MSKVLTVLGCIALLGAGAFYMVTNSPTEPVDTNPVSLTGGSHEGCCQQATSCCDSNKSCCATSEVAAKSGCCAGNEEVAASKSGCCAGNGEATTCSGSCADDSSKCCQLKETGSTEECASEGCSKEQCSHAAGASECTEKSGECTGKCPVTGQTGEAGTCCAATKSDAGENASQDDQ